MSVAVGLSPIPVLQFFGNDGKPAVGGSLLTQVGGVNYPTYSDPNGITALPNPIPLNSRGEASTAIGSTTTVFLAQGVSYTFTLSDVNSNQLWSIGNIVSTSLTIPYIATSGTNTIIATFSPAISSLVDGLTVNVKLANTTTASPTFNPNGLGATNVYLSDGVTQWPAGSGIANVTYTLVYNSSLNSSAGGWEVENPSRVTGSFTGTGTGYAATAPSATINYVVLQDGKTVQLYLPTFDGTSNATTATITGMPAGLAPTTTQNGQCYIEDNAAIAGGSWFIAAAAAVIQFGKGNGYGGGGFTNSAAKGTPHIPSATGGVVMFTYPLSP